MTIPTKDLVFISCGQYQKAEIALGRALAKAVTELTPFEGYFAENVSSVEGLSQNIFRALSRASGFVAVMHNRGLVKTLHGEHMRASVWVEQEIAIAAFLRQALDREFPVAVYVQKGLRREGVRDQLLLGPVEFETEAEVIADFGARIADGRFSPVAMQHSKDAAIRIRYMLLSKDGVHHYRCILLVANTGTELLSDYWAEVQFPKAPLGDHNSFSIAKEMENETHAFLRTNRGMVGKDIYPEEEIEIMVFPYQMNGGLFHDGKVLKEPVIAKFGSPEMTTKRLELPFCKLQEF